MTNAVPYFKSKLWGASYRIRNTFRRKKIQNENFTIFCSMCLGGLIYNSLGLKFLSPTINLFIRQKDYLKFITNLESYLQEDTMVFLPQGAEGYPIGLLQDITIHFNHYHSAEEALNKWNERKRRINYDNMYFILIEREGITYEDLKQWNELPYKNKIVFTRSEYPEFSSVVPIQRYSDTDEVGPILDKIGISGLRVVDLYFNYVKWLNGECDYRINQFCK